MVEINNQRKAFLDMLAWSEELITDVRKPKSWLWRHCRRRAIYWLLRSPRKLVTLNPKLKSTGAGRYQLLSVGGMPTQAAWPERLLSEKSGRCGIAAIKGVALYLWLIVVISVRQSTVAAISGLHCRALVMVSSSIRLTAWLQNSKKRAERSEIDVWAESPRLSPLWLSSSSACHGLLIITVITPLPTKPSATKMPENWSWRTRQLLTCRCVSVMLLRSMQNTRSELADAKAENDALRDDVAAGRRRLHIKAVYQSVREATTASGVDNAASPTGRHRWTDYFTLRERLITIKNNWKEPRSILMSSADRVAHIDGQLMQLLWAIHTRFQRV